MNKSKKILSKKSITQEHAMGCGLACVAYIVDATYKTIHKQCSSPKNAWKRGFYCPELVALLTKNKLAYKWRKFRKVDDPSQIPNGSIVFVGPCVEYPGGHFIVKVSSKKYMNPWKNFPNIFPAKSGFQSKVGKITYVIEPEIA